MISLRLPSASSTYFKTALPVPVLTVFSSVFSCPADWPSFATMASTPNAAMVIEHNSFMDAHPFVQKHGDCPAPHDAGCVLLYGEMDRRWEMALAGCRLTA